MVTGIESGHLGTFGDSQTHDLVQDLGNDVGRCEREGTYNHDGEDLIPQQDAAAEEDPVNEVTPRHS